MSDRQGQVGDLNKHSRVQLQELLLRQNNILANKNLLVALPDKGKKLRDFAEKIRLAIECCDEEERKQSLAEAASAEFQSKYRQAFAGNRQQTDDSPVCIHGEEDDIAETMETAAVGVSPNAVEAKEVELTEALQRVTISGLQDEGAVGVAATDNYFLKQQTTKKPHVVTVLERTENTNMLERQKFKPNQLTNRSVNTPSSSSSQGSSPLSAQARRERERKHLDDITAAKLPPLHHAPAQLLTLQESADLLRVQTKRHQELQAKMAAQKLSEGLKMSMGSYVHDNGPMAAYREVHDEGLQPSSEED
ncbi:protein GRINL1A [Stigmatopora nigra]